MKLDEQIAALEKVEEAIWQILDDMDCFQKDDGITLRVGVEGKGTSCCIGARVQLEDAYSLLPVLKEQPEVSEVIDRTIFDSLFGMLGKNTQEEAATNIGIYLRAAMQSRGGNNAPAK